MKVNLSWMLRIILKDLTPIILFYLLKVLDKELTRQRAEKSRGERAYSGSSRSGYPYYEDESDDREEDPENEDDDEDDFERFYANFGRKFYHHSGRSQRSSGHGQTGGNSRNLPPKSEKNLYEVLGVGQRASEKDIKVAYR